MEQAQGQSRFHRRYIKTLLKFRYALNGLKFCIKTQSSLRWELCFFLLFIIVGFLISISATEWMIGIVLSGLIIAAEIFNTAIERVCDFIHPKHHRTIGLIKDISSAGVAILCVISVVVGVIMISTKFM